MNDKAYAERRRQMDERRRGLVFQVMRLGNQWYIIRWPDGNILAAKPTEDEARALATSYGAANAA